MNYKYSILLFSHNFSFLFSNFQINYAKQNLIIIYFKIIVINEMNKKGFDVILEEKKKSIEIQSNYSYLNDCIHLMIACHIFLFSISNRKCLIANISHTIIIIKFIEIYNIILFCFKYTGDITKKKLINFKYVIIKFI